MLVNLLHERNYFRKTNIDEKYRKSKNSKRILKKSKARR